MAAMSAYAAAMEQLRAANPPMEHCGVSSGCAVDCCTGDVTNVAISRIVGALVLEALGTEWVDFGTFDNCREYGLTFTVPGWQFCVYEHRNSDEICVQGCPIAEVRPYGPYGNEGHASKYDVLACVGHEMYGAAAVHLIAALRYVNQHPNASRREVKAAIQEAEVARA